MFILDSTYKGCLTKTILFVYICSSIQQKIHHVLISFHDSDKEKERFIVQIMYVCPEIEQ